MAVELEAGEFRDQCACARTGCISAKGATSANDKTKHGREMSITHLTPTGYGCRGILAVPMDFYRGRLGWGLHEDWRGQRYARTVSPGGGAGAGRGGANSAPGRRGQGLCSQGVGEDCSGDGGARQRGPRRHAERAAGDRGGADRGALRLYAARFEDVAPGPGGGEVCRRTLRTHACAQLLPAQGGAVLQSRIMRASAVPAAGDGGAADAG